MINFEKIFKTFSPTYRFTNRITELIVGSKGNIINAGTSAINNFEQCADKNSPTAQSYIEEAIRCFQQVTSSDKKYEQAMAYFFLSLCFCQKKCFDRAYECLNKVADIKIKRVLGLGTQKPDLIRDLQSCIPDMKTMFQEYETSYNNNVLTQGSTSQSLQLLADNIGIIQQNIQELTTRIDLLTDKVESNFQDAQQSLQELANTVESNHHNIQQTIQTINSRIEEEKRDIQLLRSYAYDLEDKYNLFKKVVIWAGSFIASLSIATFILLFIYAI